VRHLAFLVHVFTACGAALALLALLSAVEGDWAMMFLWLGVALLVDGVDGMLARGLRVAERVPRWSGDTLDLVVDFTTYVFVPAYAVAAAGLMPGSWGVLAASLIAVAGALYFADTRMKAKGNYFLGFPAVWNVVVFYLLLVRPSPVVGFAIVVAFAALSFAPVRFVHPFRVRRMRSVTVALLAVWAVLALLAVLDNLAPDAWVTAALCAIAIYFMSVGLLPARAGR
jgi:phosphatidylcholine synthase